MMVTTTKPSTIHPSLSRRFRRLLPSTPSSAWLLIATSPILALEAVGVPKILSLIGRFWGLYPGIPGCQFGNVSVGDAMAEVEFPSRGAFCALNLIAGIAQSEESETRVALMPTSAAFARSGASEGRKAKVLKIGMGLKTASVL